MFVQIVQKIFLDLCSLAPAAGERWTLVRLINNIENLIRCDYIMDRITKHRWLPDAYLNPLSQYPFHENGGDSEGSSVSSSNDCLANIPSLVRLPWPSLLTMCNFDCSDQSRNSAEQLLRNVRSSMLMLIVQNIFLSFLKFFQNSFAQDFVLVVLHLAVR